MPKNTPSVVRVAMAKRVAGKWLAQNSNEEFRLTVYASSKGSHNLPGLVRAFRDGKVRLGSLDPIPDLGIEVLPDKMVLRSRYVGALVGLDGYLNEKGYETTGIW